VLIAALYCAGITTKLKRLLESSSIVKFGVGIKGDMHKLHLDYDVQLAGVLDINEEANRRVQPNGICVQGYTSFTLADHCERLLGRRLLKPTNIRCSNWEQFPLSCEQQQYAALDAYASFLVGQAMVSLPMIAEQHSRQCALSC
jgi:werner syndrome-like exonuclease